MTRRSSMVARAALALCVALGVTAIARADSIQRRGSEPGLDGKVKSVDDNGVTIRSGTGAEHTVTWDRVRAVVTDDPSIEKSVAQNLDLATNLWRARSRLERGDTALAEPLFERLFAQYRGRSHETALIVAEGLLRCRLARSANDAAVIPALEVARLRRKNINTMAYGMLPKVYDEATSLCMRVAPAWAATSGLARLDVDLKTYDAGGDTVVVAFANLYRAAAQQQLKRQPDTFRPMAEDQAGVALLRLLVSAGSGNAEQRAAARAALDKRLVDLPEWGRAWARFAIGDSLLLESGLGQRERGVVSFAYLPSTYANQQPYLAALALARMSAALASMGDASGAAAVRTEVERLFPNHPALQALQSPSASASEPVPPATQPASTGTSS